MLLEVLTVFAILNATLPEQTFQINVDLPGSQPNHATVAPVFDATMIGSVIALATGLFAAFRKNSDKVDAVADSTVNVKESLKATDYGVKDLADNLASALNKLSTVKTVEEIPQALASCAPKAKENAEAWDKDVKEYYESTPPVTNSDLGLDKTRQKLVEVNKETKKTPLT
jgi:hypothetical protein